MVSTRRQKKRADSRDLSEAQADHNETSGVVDEENTDDVINASSDHAQDDGEEAPAYNVNEEVSDLFVIDRIGGEDHSAAATTTLEATEPSNAYGISGDETKAKRKRKKKGTKDGNPLSRLLPGYTAPMQLDNSSLDRYRAAGGIKELQLRAQRNDSSTREFVIDATKQHAEVMQSRANGMVASSYTDAYASFKKGTKKAADNTAGKGWFGMVPTPMTEELKADLAVIRNRNYLDPKKFYKSADKFGSIVQLGTVIEGAAEYYSSRLTKKQRRSNLTEEIMADPESSDYARKKFRTMAQEKRKEGNQRARVHRPKRGKRFFA